MRSKSHVTSAFPSRGCTEISKISVSSQNKKKEMFSVLKGNFHDLHCRCDVVVSYLMSSKFGGCVKYTIKYEIFSSCSLRMIMKFSVLGCLAFR